MSIGRVVVPHVPGCLRPETVVALERYAVAPVDYVNVSGSDTAYAELLAELWQRAETFTVVEQDVVPHDGALAELDSCQHGYCAFPYALRDYVAPALGCTRFSAAFLRCFPDAMERVLRVPTSYGPAGHWRQLDVTLMRTILLNRYWAQPHVHLPAVTHLNEAKRLRPGAPYLPSVPSRPALREPV